MATNSLRDHKAAAHIAPLFVFIGLLSLSQFGGLKWDHPAAPWWRQQPEQWVYPLQTVVVLALVAFWWRHYTFRPLSARIVGLAAGTAVLGMTVWFAPSWIHAATGWECKILGLTDRSGPGFDPTIFPEGSGAWWTAVLLRFGRMTLAVPFAEELLWRGFLWRYLASPDGRWEHAQVGDRSLRAWLGTSVAMMLAHHPSDWLVCFLWALLAGLLAMRTRSLGACVLYHAFSNLILGLYVMRFQQWGFW